MEAALSEDKRRRFFLTLDRGGTVKAAAAAVGVSAEVGYRWCRQAGVSTPRGAPRRYSEADKATFLKLLAESGNVSAVAKELGFTRVTCYQWAHKAELAAAIFEWIEAWYNSRRRHSALGMLSPVEFEALHTQAAPAA
jgi:transposase-like protein